MLSLVALDHPIDGFGKGAPTCKRTILSCLAGLWPPFSPRQCGKPVVPGDTELVLFEEAEPLGVGRHIRQSKQAARTLLGGSTAE